MNASVFYKNRKLGTLPYHSLVSFILLCEENGLHSRWDANEKILYLNPLLIEKKVVFLPDNRQQSIPTLESEVITFLRSFLIDSGIQIVMYPNETSNLSEADLYVKFAVTQMDSLNAPKITMYHNIDLRRFGSYLNWQFKNSNIKHEFINRYSDFFSGPILDIRCELPNTSQEATRKFGEELAISLASCFLQYFRVDKKLFPLSLLLLDSLQQMIEELPKTQENQISKEIQNPVYVNDEMQTSERLEGTRVHAEVFFDHTVLPQSENNDFLVIGRFYIKNVGTENLYNPVICLRATPTEHIKLSGQIVPPNMVETLGVQQLEGAIGWKYLDGDWLQKAKTSGEYWICPIQTICIPPQGVEVLDNFQIFITKPEKATTVTVEGFVYFREQDIQFSSNNRITFGFSP